MRIKTGSGDSDAPRIDPSHVSEFFAKRAEKAQQLGSLRAVIYQDKHPDLAERRDAAEKERLLPLLDLQKADRVLDIGCGTGRWTPLLSSHTAAYHGTDFSQGLVEIARKEHENSANVRYSVLPSVSLSRDALNEPEGFDKIVVFGLLIYLNDEDVLETLDRIAHLARDTCTVLIREPVAIDERLTIKEHFSDDLDQTYNAIYRTEDELRGYFDSTLAKAGFEVIESGFVFDEASLNNRAETVQKWFKLHRTQNVTD